jgi:hypothetical protein
MERCRRTWRCQVCLAFSPHQSRCSRAGTALTQHPHSSNLTFSLDPGWAFVTTEDWRADLEAQWAYDARARTSDHEAADADVDADMDIADEGLSFCYFALYVRRILTKH